MAFNPVRFQGFIAPLNKIRYRLSYFGPSLHLLQLSTLDTQLNAVHDKQSENDIKGQHNIDERCVLDELSNLLPISPHSDTRFPRLYEHNHSNKLAGSQDFLDCLLSPEEKLRGVFLQKLKGKFAIERALTDAGVDLSIDVVAKVLNRGNLAGEWMVLFFNWAIRHPVIPKDIHSYNIIIRALGRRNFMDFMVRILYDLRTEGISPNLETLSVVLDSLVRASRVKKAISMFGNIEEFGFQRDTESLNVLLQCLCKRSHIGAANKYFNSVKGKIKFNTTTYNIIIRGWSKCGRVGEIERLLEMMLGDGFNPDCSTFSHLLEGLGRAGRIDDAVEIFDNMEEKGCVPNTHVYNAMISNFISVRDFERCMKYYRFMLSNNCDPSIDTYTKLISAFIKERKVADALEMFDEMLSRGIVPTTGTITSFIEPLCNFGPPHAAMVIYKKARKVGCTVSQSAYRLLLMRLSRFGKCGMLLNLWDEMQDSGYSPDVEVYGYVIDGLCNIGHLENAVLVMEEALRKGFCPNRLTYSRLSNKLIASNKVDRAYKLFLKIKDARRDDNVRTLWRANGLHF